MALTAGGPRLAASATPPKAAASPSCTQSVGATRAQRLVKECLAVTSATHPPCNAANACETIAEHIAQMC